MFSIPINTKALKKSILFGRAGDNYLFFNALLIAIILYYENYYTNLHKLIFQKTPYLITINFPEITVPTNCTRTKYIPFPSSLVGNFAYESFVAKRAISSPIESKIMISTASPEGLSKEKFTSPFVGFG